MKQKKLRERVSGIEIKCPHCRGDGKHHGPIPWPNCMRCAGFGTIVVIEKEEDE